MTHAVSQLASQAVYGLCGLHKDDIVKAMLVVNPDCYPTCVSLPLLLLLQASRLKTNALLIADYKSGTSDTGRKASTHVLLCEAGDNSKTHSVGGHRHLPEVRQALSGLQDQVSDGLIFVPYLAPMIRGTYTVPYLHLQEHTDPEALLREYYRSSSFVNILPSDSTPETRSVHGANLCRISVQKAPDQDDVWIVLSVIGNLVKGAAGQTVQNMSIMFDLPETTGPANVPLMP